jgi:hypothetical protein
VIAIQCWRVMLCLVRYQETEFTRTVESFMIAEFDASLSGTGVIWSVRKDGAEEVQGVSAVGFSRLGFGVDSSYRNQSDFIGAILGVIGQVILGFSGSVTGRQRDRVDVGNH